MGAVGIGCEATLQGSCVLQFSIYFENRLGMLLELTRLLASCHVHLCGISVVDTADSAVVRIVVDDPERCRQALRERAMPCSESPLVVVELRWGLERLHEIFVPLLEAEINVQYTYPLLVRPNHKPVLAIHCENPSLASRAMARAGFTILNQNDLSR